MANFCPKFLDLYASVYGTFIFGTIIGCLKEWNHHYSFCLVFFHIIILITNSYFLIIFYLLIEMNAIIQVFVIISKLVKFNVVSCRHTSKCHIVTYVSNFCNKQILLSYSYYALRCTKSTRKQCVLLGFKDWTNFQTKPSQ